MAPDNENDTAVFGEQVLQLVREVLAQPGGFGEVLSEADRQFLVEHGVLRRIAADEVLCRQFERDERAFIVLSGELAISEVVDGESVGLARLGRGELCGEIGALFGAERLSTATACGEVLLLEVAGDVLAALIARNPRVREGVIERYRSRVLHTGLRAVPLLRYLPEEARDELLEHAALLCFRAGTRIVLEGEPGDALFIVVYGTARVSHRIGGHPLNLALLGPGDYFGEWALLTGAPRAATVTASTDVEALRVDCAPFLAFIQDHPEVRDRIDQVAHNRRRELEEAGHFPESRAQLERMLDELGRLARDGMRPRAAKPRE